MLRVLVIILVINASVGKVEDFAMPSYSTAISRIIIDYTLSFFLNSSSIVNIYQVSLDNNTNVNLDIVNEVLYTIRNSVSVQLDGLTDSTVSIARHFVNIIFIDCFASFERLFRKMTLETFDYQGYFLIVVTTHMNDIYTTMLRIFEALWTNHIINANIIFMPPENNEEALLYTFFPYSPFYCENVNPIQLNQYRDRRWIKRVNYFPLKLENFHGCPLRVATFSNPPFMIINQDKQNGNVTVDGLDGIMIRVLSQHYNFNVQLFLPPDLWGDILPNGTVTGAIKMIVQKEVNMTLGFFATSPERDAVMKSGYVYYTTNLVWIVPPGKPQSALQKLINPLGPNLWILSSVTVLIGFIAIAIFRRQPKAVRDFVFGSNMQSPALNLVNMIFGGSLHHLPSRNFSRFLMGLFLFYTFILRSCYTGGLVKFMQMDTRGKRVTSTNEMLEQNFTFHMLFSARSYLLEMPRVLEHSRLLSVKDYDTILAKLTVDPYFNGAFLTSVGHLAYRNFKVFPHRFHHYAPESIYTLNIVIYMHNQSCLKTPLDRAIRNLVNGGLVAKWASLFINPQYLTQIVDEQPVPLNFTQLKGCFELLLAGLLASFHVLVIEVIVARLATKKVGGKCMRVMRSAWRKLF